MLIPNVGQIILIIIIMKMADEKMADEAAHRCVFTERTDTSVAAIKKSAGSRGQAHFADAPSPSLLIHLLKAEGRCSRMTVSSGATSHRTASHALRLPAAGSARV